MTLKQFIFSNFPLYVFFSSDPRLQGAPFVYWSGGKMPVNHIQKNIIYQYVKDNFQPNISVQQVSRILEHGD